MRLHLDRLRNFRILLDFMSWIILSNWLPFERLLSSRLRWVKNGLSFKAWNRYEQPIDVSLLYDKSSFDKCQYPR